MLTGIKKILNNLFGSFDNKDNGYSARKLTAWWFVVLTTGLQISIVVYVFDAINNIITKQVLSQYPLIIELLWVIIYLCIINLLLSLLCLGIVTFEQIIKFKEGNQHDKKKSDSIISNNPSSSDNSNSIKEVD